METTIERMKNLQEFFLLGNELERKIAEELSKIWKFAEDDSNKEWTKAINDILYRVKPIDFDQASKFVESENPEWLYDFLWYKSDKIGLKEISLVAECEWKTAWNAKEYFDSLKYDFEKLLVARSQHRLMIFEGNDHSENVENVNKLRKIIYGSSLNQIGDRYMFAVWNSEENNFFYDLVIV